MNASSDLAISLMSYPTKAASCSLVKSVRGCLCKNTSKSRSQALRTTGVRARRCATSVAPALDGFEVEIEPPPQMESGAGNHLLYHSCPSKNCRVRDVSLSCPMERQFGCREVREENLGRVFKPEALWIGSQCSQSCQDPISPRFR